MRVIIQIMVAEGMQLHAIHRRCSLPSVSLNTQLEGVTEELSENTLDTMCCCLSGCSLCTFQLSESSARHRGLLCREALLELL